MTREELFLSELALLERVISSVCGRRCLYGADAEDFASTVKLRLIENDYEILGRFEGRSSLKTYLTSVVNHLYLDYQVQRFGKWRPSAMARRLGPVALRLEALLYRDGLTFEEACGVLQTDLCVTESREELYELSTRLPLRIDWRTAPEVLRSDNCATDGRSPLERAEQQLATARTFLALRQALGRLSARDRIVLRLHVEAGLTLADVARSLREGQKSLYRRRDAALERLREDLEAAGIRQPDVRELLNRLDWDWALTLPEP
jgi:RNA polymerase sigma factor (sigma-70 family)